MELEIYLDNNATTRCIPAVISEVARTLGTDFGNPSSPNQRGSDAQHLLGTCRTSVEDTLHADPQTAIFTSGGTEANNLVLLGIFRPLLVHRPVPQPRLIISRLEHSSILKAASHLACQGVRIDYLPIEPDGTVSLDALSELLTTPADLVSVQWANSETGVIQPIDDVSRLCAAAQVRLHTDAAQAVGKLPLKLSQTPVDILTFTGHKFHAPPGVGVVLDQAHYLSHPLWYGGEQESGLRPGTLNLPGIVGLRTALKIRYDELERDVSYMRDLRDRFEQHLKEHIAEMRINGEGAPRICNTSNIQFGNVDGQALVAQLSSRGVFCSQTSACTSHLPTPSEALRAMGVSDIAAFASVRFSFSVLNDEQDVGAALEAVKAVYKKLRTFTTN